MQACGGTTAVILGSTQPQPPSLWIKSGSPNLSVIPLKTNDVSFCNKVPSYSSSSLVFRSSITLRETTYVPAPKIGSDGSSFKDYGLSEADPEVREIIQRKNKDSLKVWSSLLQKISLREQ